MDVLLPLVRYTSGSADLLTIGLWILLFWWDPFQPSCPLVPRPFWPVNLKLIAYLLGVCPRCPVPKNPAKLCR